MSEQTGHMLTTVDNPWNPFTHYDEWFAFDVRKGYFTASYLARVARLSESMSVAQQDLVIEQAIDSIVELNLLGIYKKVSAK